MRASTRPRRRLAPISWRSAGLVVLGACHAEGLGWVAPPEPPPAVEAGTELVPFPPPPDHPAALADTWYADCGAAVFPLADVLLPMAEAMSRQHIPYGRGAPDEWRDCSGSFLRLTSYLGSACPPGADALPAPPGITDWVPGERNAPELDVEARSTRDLARWYLERGRFVPVFYDEAPEADDTGAEPDDDGLPPGLAAVRHLLKPGAVVWFSKGAPRAARGIDPLLSWTAPARIHHVGVIVAVDHDEDGEVVGYSMFHGRNPGVPASITDDHRIGGAGGGPPFGNGGQYLVGVGIVLPAVSPPAVSPPAVSPPGSGGVAAE